MSLSGNFMPVVAHRFLKRGAFSEKVFKQLKEITEKAWKISKAPYHVPLAIAVLQYEIGERMENTQNYWSLLD